MKSFAILAVLALAAAASTSTVSANTMLRAVDFDNNHGPSKAISADNVPSMNLPIDLPEEEA